MKLRFSRRYYFVSRQTNQSSQFWVLSVARSGWDISDTALHSDSCQCQWYGSSSSKLLLWHCGVVGGVLQWGCVCGVLTVWHLLWDCEQSVRWWRTVPPLLVVTAPTATTCPASPAWFGLTLPGTIWKQSACKLSSWYCLARGRHNITTCH